MNPLTIISTPLVLLFYLYSRKKKAEKIAERLKRKKKKILLERASEIKVEKLRKIRFEEPSLPMLVQSIPPPVSEIKETTIGEKPYFARPERKNQEAKFHGSEEEINFLNQQRERYTNEESLMNDRFRTLNGKAKEESLQEIVNRLPKIIDYGPAERKNLIFSEKTEKTTMLTTNSQEGMEIEYEEKVISMRENVLEQLDNFPSMDNIELDRVENNNKDSPVRSGKAQTEEANTIKVRKSRSLGVRPNKQKNEHNDSATSDSELDQNSKEERKNDIPTKIKRKLIKKAPLPKRGSFSTNLQKLKKLNIINSFSVCDLGLPLPIKDKIK